MIQFTFGVIRSRPTRWTYGEQTLIVQISFFERW